ncbi:hypothetical protein F5884DRAFT_852166 [Xylogone sp. PMI_703]|nr:hypothetical protein F5884DRAFT_852166 [Xylogone sp. PMI_703]
MSTTSSEPYRKAGRGGAGNYHSKKDIEDAQRNANSNDAVPSPITATVQSLWAQYMPAFPFLKDPEPSLPSTEPATTTTSQPSSQSQSQPSHQPPQKEYLHTGRGGAGNWEYASQTSSSSSQPQPPTTSQTTTTTITTTTTTTTTTATPPLRSGRGGAGNYVLDPADEEKSRRETEEKRRRAMEERILEDVEAGLARPEAAYGGIGGVWEMGVLRGGGRERGGGGE